MLSPPGWDGLWLLCGTKAPSKVLVCLTPLGSRKLKGLERIWRLCQLELVLCQLFSCSLNRDFSAPLVCIRDQSGRDGGFQTWNGEYLWGDCRSKYGPLAWTILPQTQTAEGDPCSTDPSLLFASKGEIPFFLELSCKIFPELCVFLSVPGSSEAGNIRSVRNW